MGLFSRKVERAHVPHAVTQPQSISGLQEYFAQSGPSPVPTVTESSALGLTAVFRAVQVTASTIAGLPVKSYTDSGDVRVSVKSVFDDPGGDLLTPFEFVELTMAHMLLHGNAYWQHIYSDAGSLVALFPIHPSMVEPRWSEGGGAKEYHVTANGRTDIVSDADLTQIMGLSTDGLMGVSPIRAERLALATGIAGDQAAANMFASGLSVSAIVSPKETLSESDAKVAAASLRSMLTGPRNAGGLGFVNASMQIDPWSMNAEDAQFIESRQFSVAEVARIFGLPVQLLMQDGASSWGSGIQELIIAWVKFTLRGWTTKIEQRASRLLSNPRFVEFEYKALLQGTPREEIELLIAQKDAGLLTVDEARAIMNLPPLTDAEKEEIAPPPPGPEMPAPAEATPEEN